MKFILGKKLGMSQVFDKDGSLIPVTLVEAGPCYVVQIKNKEKDKYEAIQVGFEKIKENKVKKTQKEKPYKHLREFRGEIDISKYKIGDEINVSIFKEGEKIEVSGISKGKGFQGIIKRHGAKRKPASHGTKHEERAVGSVGPSFPQRVIKGRKMPGRMGNERVTVKNLEIVRIDTENNVLAIKGAIPGRRGVLIEIRAKEIKEEKNQDNKK